MTNAHRSSQQSEAKLAVEYRPIAELIPHAGNARMHSQNQIRKLQRSLKKFGWTNPLIIDSDNNLICGHGRLEAATRNGETKVPVISLGAMSEADRRAYIIADNKLAEEASWSKELLRAELSGLIEIGYEVEQTGFDTLEIDMLVTIGDDGPADDLVELPNESAAPISQIGDLFTIGDHRLIVGDARDLQVYDCLLGDELAELVLTDPPYGCAIANNVSGLGKTQHSNFLMGAGEVGLAEFGMTLLRPSFKAMARYSKSGAIAFVFMDWRGAPHMLDAASGVFHEVKNMIVWAKSNFGMGAFYRSAHELCYAFKISPGKHINNIGLGGRHRGNVWQYHGANTFRKGRMDDLADHPTIKPKQMIADAIIDCSHHGGIVLDPFCGSGTTLVAAEMTKRRGYGIELDPVYADVILRRVAEATGREPLLEGKVPLSKVAAQRRQIGGSDHGR